MDERRPGRGLVGRSWYWILAGVVTAFGILAFWWHFVLLGYVLFGLGAFRHKGHVFWPALAGVVFFMVAYVLVSPLRCKVESRGVANSHSVVTTTSPTRCSSLIGVTYGVTSGYQPPQWPAALVGLAAGLAAAVGAALITRRSAPAKP